MREAVFAGVEAGTFTAIAAPARTPAAIITRLNGAVNQALDSKPARDGFARQSAEVIASTPDAYIRGELSKSSKVIYASGIKTDQQ